MHSLPFRLVLGTLLAASLTACGGTSGKPEAGPLPEESVPETGDGNGNGGMGGVPGNYLAGSDALVCTDRPRDVEVARGRAPAWADLRGVTWERSGQRVIVAFQLAVKVPRSGPATFTASFGAGGRRTTARMALEGRAWTVTAGGKKIDAVVQAVVRDLVVELPLDLGGIDLGRRVTVSAATEGGSGDPASTDPAFTDPAFTDPACPKGLDWKP
ncbi:hypothetical protein [Actinocorallia longicatena]|uniref:hypothetical protein n=1 Tax=Actinocorallia longicatena TaxID=111803 RepID=UPI0031D831C8